MELKILVYENNPRRNLTDDSKQDRLVKEFLIVVASIYLYQGVASMHHATVAPDLTPIYGEKHYRLIGTE